jgi:prepilin-type N-terminal cleavage/methylation domain-containing protein
MPRAERGFTLFEVLAAVAILGLLYTTLIGWAMDGLVAEGTSRRRLEASLVADEQLAQIELGLGSGIVPPVGEERLELDEPREFEVRVSVAPFELILPEVEAGPKPAPLLSDVTTDHVTPLRRIQVRVVWLEAETEYEVVRTSFALDPTNLDTAALAQALQAVQPTPGADADAEGGAGTGDGAGTWDEVEADDRPEAPEEP